MHPRTALLLLLLAIACGSSESAAPPNFIAQPVVVGYNLNGWDVPPVVPPDETVGQSPSRAAIITNTEVSK